MVGNWVALGVLVAFSFLALFGCASSGKRVISKKIELPALSGSEEVTVYTASEPSFGYELVCTGSLNLVADENFKGQPTDFVDDAESIARECGAKHAMVASMFRKGKKAVVTIKAIRPTTESSPFIDNLFSNKKQGKKIYSQILAAALANNTKSLGTLLSKNKLQKKPKGRPTGESQFVDDLVRTLAEKGMNCAQKSMNFLHQEYGAKIRSFKTIKKLSASDGNRDDQILNCPSLIVSTSYKSLKPKKDNIMFIHGVVVKWARNGRTNKNLKSNIKKIYPEIQSDIIAYCKKDEFSEVCSIKDNFKEATKQLK